MTFDKNTIANSRQEELLQLLKGESPESSSSSKFHFQTFAIQNIEVQQLLQLVASTQPSAVFQKRDRSLRNPLHTIIALDAAATVSIADRTATIELKDGTVTQMAISGCPFEFLDAIQSAYFSRFQDVSIPDSFEFAAGIIGYFGFGLTSLIENVRKQTSDPLKVADSIVMLPQTIVHIDHAQDLLHVISHNSLERAQEIAMQVLLLSSFNDRDLSLDSIRKKHSPKALKQAGLKASITKAEFIAKVIKAKQFIEEGQCFQIVLSQRFSGPVKASAVEMFSVLLDSAPSTYNYLLNFSALQYVGASPETQVSARRDQIRLCALAGTRPRGGTDEQDRKNEIELKSNEKELAEHLMLVDLGRNDLGKVCVPGSIQVGPIAEVLKYSNVMHLGTEIYGRLESNELPFRALKACFPRGTVSGAPKLRALELLSELEPEQRGIYSGAVGFLDGRGYMDMAIAIRSALVKDGMVHVTAGAGIVYDSDPESEYLETLNKASAIASVIHRSARLASGDTSSESQRSPDLHVKTAIYAGASR